MVSHATEITPQILFSWILLHLVYPRASHIQTGGEILSGELVFCQSSSVLELLWPVLSLNNINYIDSLKTVCLKWRLWRVRL